MLHRIAFLGLALALASCASKPAPLPPTPPVPDDMPAAHHSQDWSTPEVFIPQSEPLPTPPVPPKPVGANEKLYPFVDGKEYTVEVGPGWPLTLTLEPGERFTGLVGGDRPLLEEGEVPPWDIKQTPEGAAQQHVFLTVTKPGLQMGLVVTTDKRTYYLTVKSVAKTKVRAVRWSYSPVEATAVQAKASGVFPDPSKPVYLHVGYQIAAPQPVPDWTPIQVVDNGAKLFILFPATMLHQQAPMVRGIGPNGPYLLNSRQVNRALIIDHVAPRLELRMGVGKTAEVVTITRRQLQRITCPGDEQCPQWPTTPAWVANAGRD